MIIFVSGKFPNHNGYEEGSDYEVLEPGQSSIFAAEGFFKSNHFLKVFSCSVRYCTPMNF